MVCRSCRSLYRITTILQDPPALLFLECPKVGGLEPLLVISSVVQGVEKQWRLIGIIYFSFAHFTCKYRAPDGTWWYHDGAVMSRNCSREKRDSNMAALQTSRSRVASLYVYKLTN